MGNISVFLLVILGSCSMNYALLLSSCNQQSDCQSDECCISNYLPDGKRNAFSGHCAPLGMEKSACYVRYGSSSQPPDHQVFGCPCASPLVCKGSGTFDVPLGEIGTCTHI